MPIIKRLGKKLIHQEIYPIFIFKNVDNKLGQNWAASNSWCSLSSHVVIFFLENLTFCTDLSISSVLIYRLFWFCPKHSYKKGSSMPYAGLDIHYILLTAEAHVLFLNHSVATVWVEPITSCHLPIVIMGFGNSLSWTYRLLIAIMGASSTLLLNDPLIQISQDFIGIQSFPCQTWSTKHLRMRLLCVITWIYNTLDWVFEQTQNCSINQIGWISLYYLWG